MGRQLRVLAAWLVATCVEATPCEKTGAEPPKGPTLMASPTSPARVAWVVSPDCSVNEVGAIGGLPYVRFYFGGIPIEYVASLPSDAQDFGFDDARPVAQLAALPGAQRLAKLDFPGQPADALNGVKFPDNVKELYITTGKISSIASFKLPAGLTSLTIYDNQIRSADLTIPASVTTLSLGANPITKLDRIVFASTIQILNFESCGITSVRGCKFPASLTSLTFGDNPIVNFEVRDTDYQLLSRLDKFDAYILQSKCSDSNARLVQMQFGQRSGGVCVISDARFETIYGASSPPAEGGTVNNPPAPAPQEKTPEPTIETTSSSSAPPSSSTRITERSNTTTTSTAGSASASGTESAQATTPSASTHTNEGSSSSGEGSNLVDGRGPGRSETRGNGGSETVPNPGSDPTSTTSSNKTTVIVIANVGGLIALLFVFLGGWRMFNSRRNAKADEISSAYSTLADSSGTQAARSTNSRKTRGAGQFLGNDVRNDPALVGLRIDEREIRLVKVIARGGFGIVHYGRYRGTDAAVKYLLPGGWRDTDKLTRFMDEVRISASIHHDRIVSLIGITWTSLADLAAVMEFMDTGDLGRLLHKEQAPSLESWTVPWSSFSVQNKTQIARDVAEAIAYLHSLSPPILHRDLKARNVLLDSKGRVKISDFGVSRKLQLDEKMTSEIGTAAWIAPEMLRGDQYDALADIYSFGVLLVELDRCRHPYDGHEDSSHSTNGTIGHFNMQIAMQVATGVLRPSVSKDCPENIRNLVELCLSFDPASRPTAAAVFTLLAGFG